MESDRLCGKVALWQIRPVPGLEDPLQLGPAHGWGVRVALLAAREYVLPHEKGSVSQSNTRKSSTSRKIINCIRQ